MLAARLRQQLVQRRDVLMDADEEGRAGDQKGGADQPSPLPRKHALDKKEGSSKLSSLTYAELRGNFVPHKAPRRRLPQLSITEVRAVHEAVYVNKLTHASASIKFGVRLGTVRSIVRNFKDKVDYVQELLDARKGRQAKVDMAVDEIRGCIENEEGIWSLNQVRRAVLAKHDCVLPKRLVSSVLRERFDMRFHKVNRVAFKGNSERSLVVR